MNLFYQPLVTYLPLLIKIFTPTYMLALKIYGGIMIILSGIAMYQFVYKVTGKRTIGIFAAIIYMIAPYKLANVYRRFAIGEFTAMIFIPYVFMGLYNLFEQDRKKHYYIAIGAIGLMLSHTITTLYVAIFCFIYILFNYKKLKDIDILKKCAINIIFIVLVSMLFWFPLLEATSQADYTIMDNKIMGTNPNFVSKNIINLSQLFADKGEENGTTFLIGIPTIITIILTIFAANKVDKKYKSFYLLNIIFAFISLWFASRFFPWNIAPAVLWKIQYPWRTIGLFNFFISFVCGINIYVILKNYIAKDVLKTIIILIFTIVSIISSLMIESQFFTKDPEIDKIYEDYIMENKKITHEWINRDYMPVRAINLQKTYVKEREDRTYILEGNGEIVEENKENLKDIIKVKNVEKNTELELPYYYYPGYEVKIKTKDKEERLKNFESEHGYISCTIEESIEEAEITVEYVGTTITYFSYTVSAISFIVFIIYIIYENKRKK